jgi:acetyl-CoA C-acetyltransferase
MDWTRVPVIVGGGQVTNRVEDPVAAPDPFELMTQAARLAAADVGGAAGGRGGAPAVLGQLTHCFMVHSLSVRHGDPAAELARRVGAPDADARCSGMGGSIPQWLVNRAAELVVAGGRPRVLIAGAEALATRRRARRQGIKLSWPTREGWPQTWPPLEADLGIHAVERAHGLDQATSMYALIESAISHAAKEDPSRHAEAMGSLMAGLNAVAAENPLSWFPTRRDASEIMTVAPDNRMICYPYPKYVNAVMAVDMAAAVIVTDAATARSWGAAPDDVAYLTGWADAHDVWYLSQRPALQVSPALVECGRRAADSAGVDLHEIGAFDLYSCFPSSVEVARDSFGIAPDDNRPLTLTGGLPYHGGPGNNYVTHAIANTRQWLRDGRADQVLVHGNGYYLTKESVGVYSRLPPDEAPRPPEMLQEHVDGLVQPLDVVASAAGTGSIVAYTVPFDRAEGPRSAIVMADVGTNRTLALADDALTQALLEADLVGDSIALEPDGEVNRAHGV